MSNVWFKTHTVLSIYRTAKRLVIQTASQPVLTARLVIQTASQPVLTARLVIQTASQPVLTARLVIQTASQPVLTARLVIQTASQPVLTARLVIQTASQPVLTARLVIQTASQPVLTARHRSKYPIDHTMFPVILQQRIRGIICNVLNGRHLCVCVVNCIRDDLCEEGLHVLSLLYDAFCKGGTENRGWSFSFGFWFWRYLTSGFIWDLSQSSIRPSIYFTAVTCSWRVLKSWNIVVVP